MERNRSDEKKDKRRRTPSGAAIMQERVTRAIERAVFREWAATGYAALSMEAVARRAGVGKAALYRRWPSKLAMVSDVITRVDLLLASKVEGRTLRDDVAALLRQVRRMLRNPLVARILPDLHAEMPRNLDLAAAIRSNVQVNRRARAEEILERAIMRGELPVDIDKDLAIDMLGALLYWRMIVIHQPADDAYLDRLTDFVLRALGVSIGH
ncbi:TetR/AcrR family transcriptional regulator [Pleomorphomonas sp. NRK KF1]|uniref:TetR/AcrR family transcriptional regulator n=1 Tax=Pleomorphomonas sp. NRK KF1 TaxID=2943000 RepID=UPI002043DC3A|nr:TetR/AcrR family transcriptional regulator [Pleomorphomonas sp. NRK KF1]MCM5555734.1 TetR/AcrR family transcriptional regulator [Pleomorphomonas sp. NRK KF1]